jgi:ectoine hydroxylase-related dioxygenase (phytanoyl-CoA dioxygenase family)
MTEAERLRRAADDWRRDGWVLIEELVSRDLVDVARKELIRLGRPHATDTSATRPRYRDVPDEGPAFRAEQFTGTRLFPVPDAVFLNRLVVHPAIVEFARLALRSDDIRLYQARVASKFGGRTNYEQTMHRDLNHSLVPTRSEPGWWHLESFLYLGDVDESNGAILLVPRPHDRAADPELARAVEPSEAPHLYDAEVRVPAPAGSLLAYRSDVWHRGADLEPGTERHVVILGYKPAGLEWIGYDSLPPLSINPDFVELVEACTPDELALFGFPAPGHAYWTSAQLEATAVLYPGLDLDPWWAAL